VEKAIKQAAGSLLVDVALFDVYRGAGVASDSRSLAYRLRLQAMDRTLSDAELTDVRSKVIAGVAKLDATLRG
jgi:phenylalanyl-tRNA synthetase beta chain